MEKRTDYSRINRIVQAKRIAGQTFSYVLLTVWAILVLFPFYWMILTSIKSYSAYSSEFVPKFITLAPSIFPTR